jgi:hypothetical protein
MQRFDPFATILSGTILVLGMWAIYTQISVLLGLTFHQLLTGAWIPAAAILVVTLVLKKSKGPLEANPDPEPQPVFPTLRSLLLIALMSVTGILILRPGNWISASIYTGAVLLVLARIGDRVQETTVPNERTLERHQSITVLIVIVAAIIVTLCEHSVNWDDAKYLHNVANALEYPDEPMLVYEHLHGVNQLKIYHPSVRLQTYELTVAAISKVLGVSHLNIYYLILPPIWAALAVIAQWVLIRRLAGKHAAVALIVTFVLLCVWRGQRSYGAFSFDFVGRGIFLSFTVPVLISAAVEFAETANYRNWLALFLTTWTGCLLTSTAYAVAPMAICLVLIASYGLTLSKARDFAFGILAFIWCPLLLAYVTWANPIVTPLDVDSAGGAHFVFRGTQGRIALALFAIAPFLLLSTRLKSGRWLLRYNALSCMILLSGILLTWIGKHSSILSWRLLWAIPVPVIIGVGISSSMQILKERFKTHGGLQKIVPLVGTAIVAVVFSATGNTVQFRDFGWPVLKVDKAAFPVARSIVRCSKPKDLVLAPPQIAVPIAGLIGAPSLVAVRGHHLSYLTAQWGEEESERRKRLFNIVQGKRNSREDVLWARDQLLSGSVNRIVLLKSDSRELEPMNEMLRSLQMDHIEQGQWDIWLPNTSRKEAMQLRNCLQRDENL